MRVTNRSTSILWFLVGMGLCIGTIAVLRAIIEWSQGPRGVFFMLGCGALGYTLAVALVAQIRHSSRRGEGKRSAVAHLTALIAGLGVIVATALITLALTFGSSPA